MILISLFLTTLTFADSSKFQIEFDPNYYDQGEYQLSKDVEVTEIETQPASGIPDRSEREKIFARVPGLEDQIKHLDELDRDVLLIRARTLSLTALEKLYPAPGFQVKTLEALLLEVQALKK